MLWVPLALAVIALIFDLKSREIPDTISILLLLWAVGVQFTSLAATDWLGLLGGCALGFGVGLLLFRAGGFGGGDVKFVSALGAVTGPLVLLEILIYIAITGGVFAVIAAVRSQREFAYMPAITLGLAVYCLTHRGTLEWNIGA